jgi:hypothetical protein
MAAAAWSGAIATCMAKVGYDNPALAYLARRRMRKRGKLLYPYRCRVCRGWHLSHAKPHGRLNRAEAGW